MVVSVEHLTVDLPVYRAGSRSLKGTITDLAVGGIFRGGRSGTLVVRALDDLSFELKQGDRLALIGHNGAGKTTLLRTLAGVYRPTGGTVTVDGEVSNMFDIQLGLDPEASGRENIYLLGYSRGLSAKRIGAAIPEVIEFSGLGAYIDLPVKTYSTGMGSRLAFAVATSFAPDILLMDEWISTGDAEFIARAEARLQERVGQARIVVLASHDFNLIRRVCNRVLVLHHGRMVGMGGPHDIDALLARREEVNTLPPEAGPAASA